MKLPVISEEQIKHVVKHAGVNTSRRYELSIANCVVHELQSTCPRQLIFEFITLLTRLDPYAHLTFAYYLLNCFLSGWAQFICNGIDIIHQYLATSNPVPKSCFGGVDGNAH